LQDNGGSLLLPEDLIGNGTMGSPFGGDGGDTLVDPNDGCTILQEYVFLAMQVTENCGRSDGTVRSVRDIDPGDPFPRRCSVDGLVRPMQHRRLHPRLAARRSLGAEVTFGPTVQSLTICR